MGTRVGSGTAIIDFGLGNLRSLEHKLSVAGLDVRTVTDPTDVLTASHLILPGVGHFGPAMVRLTETGLGEAIVEAVRAQNTPILGICLGMQLLTDGSEESGTSGLGLVPGRTVHLRNIAPAVFPLPHIGWASVAWRPDRLPGGLATTPLDCYFSHSYHVECDEERILATANYGSAFIAGVIEGRAAGVQFHPEKSHRSGIDRLIELIAAQSASGGDS